jgi:release factor glutamine methyltransferase
VSAGGTAHAWTREMPEQYAAGEAAFRHLLLHVDSRVLIPRPETEGLVDLVLDATRVAGRSGRGAGIAVDVGTGSGAIALSLASEGAFDCVIGVDLSADALAVARTNLATLPPEIAQRVELRMGSYLAPVRDLAVQVVVSNPPYITYGEAAALPASVREWEPPIALYTGDEGLAATAAIVREAAEVLVPGGLLALEVDERRAARVVDLLRSDGRYMAGSVRRDLAGRDRYVLAARR